MQVGTTLDPTLFWVPAMYFYYNAGLSDEHQHLFLKIMGSVPESPFVDLVVALGGQA